MAHKGRNGAFEEFVIRLQCKIPKTGNALETSESSGQRVMSRQIITNDEEVPIRPQRAFPDRHYIFDFADIRIFSCSSKYASHPDPANDAPETPYS